METKLIFVNFSENFSRLTVYFRFERHIGHHLIQTFAPSALVVVLSWFSFYLGLDAIPGRVTLLVTCMLTLVTMFTGLRSDIPPVAYVKVNLQPGPPESARSVSSEAGTQRSKRKARGAIN